MFKPVSPQTDFPKLERELLDRWYKTGIVEKYLRKNEKSKEKFSFLDGPITANNPMGVHHAWGRTYKDFWQRFWNMEGKKQRFQNGFDEQGLWVEVEVEKELGLRNKKEIENLVPGDRFKSLEKFINLCKERVAKFSKIQTDQSKRLGYFMDWDHSYHTSSDENNYTIWGYIKNVKEKGWLYKGRDSVPWCPRCGTAISQHEILTEEYKELTHKTVVFKLKVKAKDNEYLLAWTTTPWTIPANVALAVDPNLSYWKMTDGKEFIYLINPTASGDLRKEDMLVNKLGLHEGWEKVEEVKGKDLVGIEYEGPFDHLPAVIKALKGYTHRVIASDPLILPINPAEGTGIVHVATGAGQEDFKIGKKEKLPVIEIIDEVGVTIEGFEFLTGEHVKKSSPLVLEDLDKRQLSFKEREYTHRYPTCWRCKTELVWRVVDEWYIAMDRKDETGKTYREQMMEVSKKINWMPDWGLERELDWLKNMHDWLISKKRYWGLALPIWVCDKCGDFQVVGGKEELREKAIEGWDEFEGHSPHRPWIDQIKVKCEKCGSVASRIPDVGNPWLDAGIVPFSTLPQDWFPADFITESFPGQFKNWFYSLIAMSTAMSRINPVRRILGFGSVRDEKGEEMHKSKGNSIEFNEAADKVGVDVMRWLYLRTNPEHNVNFGYSTLEELRRLFLLKLWNSYSFFVSYANAYNWSPGAINFNSFSPNNITDKWILSRMTGNLNNMKGNIEEYMAFKATGQMEIFIIDLSNWYVRRNRERFSRNENISDRNEAFTTLWIVLTEYSKAMSNFIPFVSDEIYTNLAKKESVHLEDWPKLNPKWHNPELEKRMDEGIMLASVVQMRRKVNNVPVAVPLKNISYTGPHQLDDEILDVIKGEVNAENINYVGHAEDFESFGASEDLVKEYTDPGNQDKASGEARKIIRQIQEERKNLGTSLDEKINVSLPAWPKEHEEEIKRRALIENLSKGEFKVTRV